jgi:hypothetical protein
MPAAQAAGADPSRCNSTNRKKLPFTKMALIFEPVMRFDAHQDLESSKLLEHSQFYN